jgi:hypothetical protein
MLTTTIQKVMNEQLPCDGCMHASRCGADKLACYAFAMYVYSGDAHPATPRKPTRRTYARVMWFEDATLVREINRNMRDREIV